MTLLSFIFTSSTIFFDSSYIYCLPGFIITYGYLFNLLKKLDLNNR